MRLIPLLLCSALLVGCAAGFSGDRTDAARKAPPPSGRANVPAIMVACRQCGTHLPETEAVQGSQGAYCSADHRRQYEG